MNDTFEKILVLITLVITVAIFIVVIYVNHLTVENRILKQTIESTVMMKNEQNRILKQTIESTEDEK